MPQGFRELFASGIFIIMNYKNASSISVTYRIKILLVFPENTNHTLRVFVKLYSSHKITGPVVLQVSQKSSILPSNEHLNINFIIYKTKSKATL